VKDGGEVTVLAYGGMVPRLEALTRGDEAVEVIDLRALDLANVDYETIGRSVNKTGALVIADEAPRSCSIGAMIGHECAGRFFDALDGPVLRITGADVPLPVSRVLEAAAIPSDEEIVSVIGRAARREV
jgi:2-oxoisovalerate dehydrogenase E1 component